MVAAVSADDEPLVVVVGLGGVGSHCAHALVRSGIRRLRLIDFDRVSLSSLNRHAVALRRDVGVSKVVACAQHFRAILPGCCVDVRDEMFTAAAAERLLLGDERPAIVVDCIDDLNTKADLIAFCVENKLHVVSALGSGAKDDPTKFCVGRGLREIDNDPLATKLRRVFSARGIDVSGVSFAYSSQKVQKALLPLSDEQRANPEEFGNVANFRLRVIPVLGTQPAAAGIGIGAQVLNELNLGGAQFWPQPTPAPRRNLVDKLMESLKKRELKADGGRNLRVDVTPAEATFMVHEVWFGRSALNPELDAFAATGIRFTLMRWDPQRDITPDNLILASVPEADKHTSPVDVPAPVRERIEASLRWARKRLAQPVAPGSEDPSSSPLPEQVPALQAQCECVGDTTKEDAEQQALSDEQLSRSSSFLGEDGHARVRAAFVAIVGLGAVGSAAAILLARAGVGRLRLIDGGVVRAGAAHAVSCASDVGMPKVDVCRSAIRAVLPSVQVETQYRSFNAGEAEAVLGASEDGRRPDVVLDCLGGVETKADLLQASLNLSLRVISIVVGSALCSADPSRFVAAPLSEVWANPAGVLLRQLLHQRTTNGESALAAAPAGDDADSPANDPYSAIEVIHSQEAGLWGKLPPPSDNAVSFRNPDAAQRLGLGVTAAAAALFRIIGKPFPQQADPCAMNFWKKLRRGLMNQEGLAGNNVPGLYDVGCVADYVWRARSPLSRETGAKHGDLALTRWDRSKPISLSNLVLLTSKESKEHMAESSTTGTLPPGLLAALEEGRRQPRDDSLLSRQLETHAILQRLHAHLQAERLGRRHVSPSNASMLKSESIELSPKQFNSSESHACSPKVSSSDASERENALSSVDVTFTRGRPLASRPGFSGLVGGTPLVELRCLSQSTGCTILGKAEFLSPGGCQKDRVARQMIDEAEEAGLLKPGATIVEGTSGSTGISLCLAAGSRGYRVHVVMPDDQAAEKVQLLRRFGATVQLVRPAAISSPEHYVNVARRHAATLNAQSDGGGAALFADQFENPANFNAHYKGTGPELWEQCGGRLDAFVMSAGTGGTLAGIGRFVKEKSPETRICLADVQGSALYSKVANGVLYAPEQQERTVRRHRADTIAEGIGIDRLTANFALGLQAHNGGYPGIDEAVRVTDQEALDMAHHLLAHEGLFLGSSAAVNCVAAVKLARKLPPGSVVATVLCDGGQRHLTKFYDATAWTEYELSAPTARESSDLSFVM